MTMISIVSLQSAPAASTDDHSHLVVTLFCCVGLMITLCLMASGIDPSAGWA
jgi:hypothetical protein